MILDLDPGKCKQAEVKVEAEQKIIEKADMTTQVNCVNSVKNIVKAQKQILNPSVSRNIESRVIKDENATGSASIEDSFAMEFESQSQSQEKNDLQKEKYLLEEIEEFVNKL